MAPRPPYPAKDATRAPAGFRTAPPVPQNLPATAPQFAARCAPLTPRPNIPSILRTPTADRPSSAAGNRESPGPPAAGICRSRNARIRAATMSRIPRARRHQSDFAPPCGRRSIRDAPIQNAPRHHSASEENGRRDNAARQKARKPPSPDCAIAAVSPESWPAPPRYRPQYQFHATDSAPASAESPDSSAPKAPANPPRSSTSPARIQSSFHPVSQSAAPSRISNQRASAGSAQKRYPSPVVLSDTSAPG